MPKRNDIKRILVIGSGPIVIGQAAEFDYAGTEASLSLREEGYEVILCNSNPATIMTDKAISDKIYMEPLNLEYLAKIIRTERPDAILPGIGGQTGLNLAVQLEKKGVLEECNTKLLGTSIESIEMAEDRELFKELCNKIGEPVLPSQTVRSVEDGIKAAKKIGYPLALRPAFTLGGSGGGFAENEDELISILKNGLLLSPVSEVLIEKSVKGYKEIEYEVIRDKNDTAISVCNMENMDPVGIHTGDSIVFCPSQTLSDKEYQMLRDSALKIIRALKINGGCNVQFALDTKSFNYYVIEVNPRVSRSSALASKASGYPIARVSAKIAVGMTLDEIKLINTLACFEPALDYVVTKMPRFPFDKFTDADQTLGTQMKATGEVMSIGRTLEESLLKAIRSLEIKAFHLYMEKYERLSPAELMEYIKKGTGDRIFCIAALLRKGDYLDAISEVAGIDKFFLYCIENIINTERELSKGEISYELLLKAKKMGFTDNFIGNLLGLKEKDVYSLRKKHNIFPVYKMIDTCASEFSSYVPYFYGTYENENESLISDRKKIIVLGSGPIRIGQGVEFDYSTVHAVKTLKEEGYEAIVINNNPETVSTDYTTSDKLYFEPLYIEDVMNIISLEKPEGVIVSLGGQTAVNLSKPLHENGVKLIGTDFAAIDMAENRDSFELLLKELKIPESPGEAVLSVEDGIKTARNIEYPVLVRPSFVLGGRAMQIVSKEKDLRTYLKNAFDIDKKMPVLVDHYIVGRELEVDAICDGKDIFIPGIMELVERTGVHSGDSISVYPTFSVSDRVIKKIIEYTKRLGISIGIRGLYNIQFIVDENEDVYIIEVNPRSSRTVPFLSKATGFPLSDIATRVSIGISLREQGIFEDFPKWQGRWFVKAPVFSFSKLSGMDSYLSPEMKSTGEAIGYDKKLHRAMYKALTASGIKLLNYGTVLFTLADEDKEEALPLAKRFYDMGFNIEGTTMTADYFKAQGIRTRTRRKISEGSTEILDSIRAGYVSYVVNTRAILSGVHYEDGVLIRRCASENCVTMFTSLDTVRVLLDVLAEMTIGVSTI